MNVLTSALALSFLLLAGRASAQSLTQQCVDEFGVLANNTSVSAANEERGNFFESQTGQCPPGLDTCTIDYTPIASSYDGVCVAAGGQTLTFSYSISCPNRAPLVFQSFPLCTGASCDGEQFIEAFISIRADQLVEDGLTGCVVERVEDRGTPPPSNVTTAPSASPGGSTLLSQQCVDEIQALALTESVIDARNQTGQVGETQITNCQNVTACQVDYSSIQSTYQLACEQEGGSFVTFDYSITCANQGIEFLSFPDCIGTSCDLGNYYTAFEAASEAALAEGNITGCIVEVKVDTPPPTPAPVNTVTTAPVAAPTEAPVAGCDEETEALLKDNSLVPVMPALNDDNCNAGLCNIDYSTANTGYKSKCEAAGGQFGDVDATISCTTDSGSVRIEVTNFPYCAGTSCSTALFEEAVIGQLPIDFDTTIEQDSGTPVNCVGVDPGTAPDAGSGAPGTVLGVSTVIAIMSVIAIMW